MGGWGLTGMGNPAKIKAKIIFCEYFKRLPIVVININKKQHERVFCMGTPLNYLFYFVSSICCGNINKTSVKISTFSYHNSWDTAW